MSWEDILKESGRSQHEWTGWEKGVATEIAEDLDFGEGDFWLYLDDFNIDIEVSNASESNYPSETFAIRVQPSGTIQVMDENVGDYKPNNVIKTFTEKDIVVVLDGTGPKPMGIKSGAFLFEVNYRVDEYYNGKLYISVKI